MITEYLFLFTVAAVTTVVCFRRMEPPGQVAKRLHREINSDE